MLPGETILSGAPDICPDCKKQLMFEVLKTCAYYIGTFCDCGPYSRESGYFKTKEEADKALEIYKQGNPLPNARY